jgi:hypothetical protein
MIKMLSVFHDGFGLVLSLQLFGNYLVPEPVLVLIEVHWQVGRAIFPIQMHLWRLRVRSFVLSDHRLTLQLFSFYFCEEIFDIPSVLGVYRKNLVYHERRQIFFLFLDEVTHGPSRYLVQRQDHGAGQVESLLLFFVGNVGTVELQTQVNVFQSRMVLQLFGKSLVIPQ